MWRLPRLRRSVLRRRLPRLPRRRRQRRWGLGLGLVRVLRALVMVLVMVMVMVAVLRALGVLLAVTVAAVPGRDRRRRWCGALAVALVVAVVPPQALGLRTSAAA